MGEEVILLMDDLETSFAIHCRICHEAEFESSKSLEAPCACSGTVKFAHRDCIQRWCNEKGNTTCEICLQNYEPGYTAPSKKAQILQSMNIRDSLEILGSEDEMEEEEESVAEGEVVDAAAYSECTSAAERSSSFCRSLALMLTLLLLLRDLYATCAGGTGDYPFTLLTILILRASGIVLPMYIVIRTISAIRKSIRGQNQGSGRDPEVEGNEDEQLHLV